MKLGLKLLPAVAIATVLSACNTTGGLQKDNYPQPISMSDVSFKTSSSFDKSRIESVEKKTFRTFLKIDDTTVREVRGAKCEMRSSEFSVKFITPAEVNVPLIKGEPKPLKLTCQKGGLRSSEVLKPVIPQAKAGVPLYTGGGIAGVIVGVAVDAAVTGATNAARNSKDVWRFAPKSKTELPILMK